MNIDTDKMTLASDKCFGLVDSCHETWRRIQQYAEMDKFQESSPHIYIYVYYLLLSVFNPWDGLGRDQSSVRQLVWLWYAASWASS